ncbi:Os11g0682600 [Oryza sativa Japonica Group]|uniref:Os11g0682600 protein n=1 Tax=Oryza sativa subsp. japonica TaxID=39947 RepID=C7J9C7_ORYSJ|nr:Os11g0682600 [Oryza sativa Japonica Group]|eukprot:NP_001176718.1 Os11g0682600 [Oryza sativa Japonica Group]
MKNRVEFAAAAASSYGHIPRVAAGSGLPSCAAGARYRRHFNRGGRQQGTEGAAADATRGCWGRREPLLPPPAAVARPPPPPDLPAAGGMRVEEGEGIAVGKRRWRWVPFPSPRLARRREEEGEMGEEGAREARRRERAPCRCRWGGETGRQRERRERSEGGGF